MNVVNKMCEGCQQKYPSFGLPLEGKARWCDACSEEHVDSVNVKGEAYLEAGWQYLHEWANPDAERGRCRCDGCENCKQNERQQFCTQDPAHADHCPSMPGHLKQTQVTISANCTFVLSSQFFVAPLL